MCGNCKKVFTYPEIEEYDQGVEEIKQAEQKVGRVSVKGNKWR